MHQNHASCTNVPKSKLPYEVLFVRSVCMHLRPTLTMTFFPGKPEGADGEDMETESHVDTQVSHWTLSLSVFVILFCFLVFFFFGGNKQVAHLA